MKSSIIPLTSISPASHTYVAISCNRLHILFQSDEIPAGKGVEHWSSASMKGKSVENC
jgi:hypothetical protein